jgi:hypothetical protein
VICDGWYDVVLLPRLGELTRGEKSRTKTTVYVLALELLTNAISNGRFASASKSVEPVNAGRVGRSVLGPQEDCVHDVESGARGTSPTIEMLLGVVVVVLGYLRAWKAI